MNIENELFRESSYDERYLKDFANLLQAELSDSTIAYVVLMPDEAVMYDKSNAKAQRLKRVISCFFSFGVNQNTIRTLSLKQTIRYIKGTILFYAMMSVIALIGVLSTTHDVPIALVACILVASFCYGPIQLMTIPFERLKFYVENNTIHPTGLWCVDKVKEISFDDFYAMFINRISPLKYCPLKSIVSLYRKFLVLNIVANCNQYIQDRNIPETLLNLNELVKGCEVYIITQGHEILKYSQSDGR